MAGVFITFEGIEGCGKTSQVRRVDEFLKLKGYDTVVTREPGGTYIGDQIRKVLLATFNRNMLPVTELFLYASARCQHVEEIIRPALREEKIVLCDRFSDATEAYQGAARKISPEFLKQIHQMAAGGLKPNLTILLDCPVALGLKRATKRNELENKNGREDRFERENLEFHDRVRKGYLEIARQEPSRVKVIDASASEGVVYNKIIEEVMKVI